MKIVYIAGSSPVLKSSRRDDLKQAATLLASQLNSSLQSKRKAAKIMEIELGANWKEGA